MRDSLRMTMRGVRLRRAVLGLCVAMGVLGAFPSTARADAERVKFLSEKLKADDFRVRTNAALSLGAENDDGAVDPLCGALSDTSEVVRQASAVALKRLNRSRALGCLKAREGNESNDGVKVQITRAIEAISAGGVGGGGGGGGNDETPKNIPGAKYYVLLSSVANATSRGTPEIEAIVLKAMKAKLESSGTIQLAPRSETLDAAKSVLAKRKIKGFYLAVAIDKFDYSGGNLRVKVKVGVFSYPNKSLLGNVDKAMTAQGISTADKGTEDQLLDLAASKVSEQFAENASAF